MNVLNKLISIIFSKEKNEPAVCCAGCKHLFYWNDGSVGCYIEREHDCIPEGFVLREEREYDSQE